MQIALGLVAAATGEVVELFLGFDSFGNRGHVEGVCKTDNRRDEGAAAAVTGSRAVKTRSILRLSMGSSDSRAREE